MRHLFCPFALVVVNQGHCRIYFYKKTRKSIATLLFDTIFAIETTKQSINNIKNYDYEDDVFNPDDSRPERESGESWELQAGS